MIQTQKGPLRVLVVEDRPSDAELMVAELRRAGYEPVWSRVETEAEFAERLAEPPDLILADYTMPGFGAVRALEILRSRGVEVPFIIVSGSIGEDTAVAAMRAGAADYLLKDRLARLGPAVARALELKSQRQSRHVAEQALRESEERFRRLADNAPDIIFRYRLAPSAAFEYVSPAVETVTGFASDEFYADPRLWLRLVHAEDRPLLERIPSTRSEFAEPLRLRLVRKDGAMIWVEQRRVPVYDVPGHLVAIEGITRDITRQKLAGEQAARRLEEVQALRDIDTAITGSLDRNVVLGVLLDKTTTHLHVDAAAVLLFDPQSQMLVWAAGRGFRGSDVRRSRIRIGQGQAGRAARERVPVRVENLADLAGDFTRWPLIKNEGFAGYAAAPLVAKGQIKGVLEVFHRTPLRPDDEWIDFLGTLAGQAAVAIDSLELFESLQRANADLTLAYDTTLEGWVRALDLRDKETEGHTQRVTELTMRLARAMAVDDERLLHVRRGALLHDIGKIGIPDSILLKPGPLTEDEWSVMRRHPVYAHQLISAVPYLRPALSIPYEHHEKWDGTGYPRGLRGEAIRLEARIFAAVDVYDALTSDRPYRSALPRQQAIQYLRDQAGVHFDPAVVDAFTTLVG